MIVFRVQHTLPSTINILNRSLGTINLSRRLGTYFQNSCTFDEAWHLRNCNWTSQQVPCRGFKSERSRKRNEVAESKQSQEAQVTIGHRVVETSKNVSYVGIILVGVGITGLMFYTIGKELFSSNSPNTIYTNALKLCKSDQRVIDSVGVPIKAYGETTRRGWRKHVSHLEYEKEGVGYLRMKFYIQGRFRKGTVNLEMKKSSSGVYDYRYLFVDLDGYPQQTIVIKDNR
ncbi:mitochondrial import inner membrane translocase subunit Tim21-like [Saccoglossus kowalevskii]|uniref:Mitochondrial import inner membrane translocase subunit Tim21 n=1 Tax=Saccoglossus kowalevskii TaxID=10224 RepID=A0ABM0MUF0_SACKO|nr:PREDICTED: mitochondrial import inner membrane translocase subunit Tim21-like [Saccoglossus kowalevskii]